MQVLFVQGAGKGVHDDWDEKLVESLKRELGKSYDIQYPRMPDEAEPNYSAWKSALEEEFERLADGALLVGHSVGATILLHTIVELLLMRRFGAVFLIAAPFIGKGGWPSEEIESDKDFRQFLAGVPIFLYHGTNDEIVPCAHARLYAKFIPHASIRLLKGRNHQLNNDLSDVARDVRSLNSVI